jgi:hypothetical protein
MGSGRASTHDRAAGLPPIAPRQHGRGPAGLSRPTTSSLAAPEARRNTRPRAVADRTAARPAAPAPRAPAARRTSSAAVPGHIARSMGGAARPATPAASIHCTRANSPDVARLRSSTCSGDVVEKRGRHVPGEAAVGLSALTTKSRIIAPSASSTTKIWACRRCTSSRPAARQSTAPWSKESSAAAQPAASVTQRTQRPRSSSVSTSRPHHEQRPGRLEREGGVRRSASLCQGGGSFRRPVAARCVKNHCPTCRWPARP